MSTLPDISQKTTEKVAAGPCDRVHVIPTVSASPDYSIDDVLGSKMTIDAATRIKEMGALLHMITMTCKVDIPTGVTVDVLLFDTDPTNSTFTDNSGIAVNTADLPYLIAAASLTERYDLGTPAALVGKNLGIPCKPQNNLNRIYAVAVVRSAATLNLGSTSDIEFSFHFLQD
jgi:hypothetical protein